MVPFYPLKVRWWFPIVTIALFVTVRPQFAIECLRRLNQQRRDWKRMVTLGQNVGECGDQYIGQILTRSGKHIGLSYAKEIVLISSNDWAQCTNLTDN